VVDSAQVRLAVTDDFGDRALEAPFTTKRLKVVAWPPSPSLPTMA
jgi:hypothetical protein